MEKIKADLAVASDLLAEVKARPGTTGPKQLALLQQLLVIVTHLAAQIDTAPSA